MDGTTTSKDDTPIVLGACSSDTSKDDPPCSGALSSPPPPQDPSQVPDEESSSLDCPICLQTCVHPVELPCAHIFCFLCIKGVAAQGNSRCAICRANIPNNVLTNPRLKDISQLFKDPKLCNSFQWFYESRGGGWWMYDERTMQELENAYDSKLPTCRVLIAGNLYEIDFGQMIQYRLNNPSLFRRIKRDYGTVEKRGIAGIRLNNQGNSQDAGGANNLSSSVENQRIQGRGLHHPDSAELFEVDSDEECDDEDDDDEDDEEEDDDMDLENSEDDEPGESSDSEDHNLRDGARNPTRNSDRSNSSSNNQTPPSTPSGQNGSYSHVNGPSSGRGSRCGGVSRNFSNSRNSSSASSNENNSSEPNHGIEHLGNSESGNVDHRQSSSVTPSSAPSSVMFNIDELNINNSPLDNNGSLSYIIIGPSSSPLQIRLQYNSNSNYEMDEIL